MTSLAIQNFDENELTKTLYEICKTLGTHHSNAMNRVMPELMQLESFSLAAQSVQPIKTGKGRIQEIKTYRLNQDQSMIVAARLSPKTLEALVLDWKATKEELHSLKTGQISTKKQVAAMIKLHDCLPQELIAEIGPLPYIKINTIANKASSTYFGHKKSIKKDRMPPEMLEHRDKVVDTCIYLYESMGYDAHISKLVYQIHAPKLTLQ